MKTTKFKPSEVGPIPEEWEVKALGEVGVFSKGLGVSRSESNSGALPCVRYGEIYTDYNDYIKEFRSFISEKVAAGAKLMSPGDILFAGSGETKEEIGKTVAFLGGVDRAYCGGDILILSPSRGYDSKFLGYVCNSQPIVAQKASRGQGDAVVHIRSGSLAEVVIPVPPRPEQEKIAEALSDVDALLAAMTKLIEKKRAIKQGAMQQLLTGKKRLAGFTGKWVEKRLGDCALIKARIGWQGLTTAEYLKNGPYYLITGSDFNDGRINWSQCYFVDKARYDQDKYIQIKKDDVLVSKDGTIGKVAFLDDVPGEGTLNSGVFVIRSTDKMIDQPYLAWVFLSRWFDNFIDRLVAGSTIVHLYQKDIVGFEFPVPPTFAEQKAIAAVLSDMDAEIASLESKRAKYESIKQGMMQELLTGKTRLED